MHHNLGLTIKMLLFQKVTQHDTQEYEKKQTKVHFKES